MAFQPSGPLDCRVAIVTGGSRGIGHSTALRLAELDWAVVVNYVHDQETAEAVVEAILNGHGTAMAVRADVSDELDVERLFAATVESFGVIDAVVHAVRGQAVTDSVSEVSVTDFDRMLRTGPRAAFLVNRQAARQVRRGGGIVNLAPAVSAVNHKYGAFASTAEMIETLCRTLALDLHDRRVNVNGLSLDVGKPCEPDRVAAVIAYLLSDAGRGITGQFAHIDRLPPNWKGAADDQMKPQSTELPKPGDASD